MARKTDAEVVLEMYQSVMQSKNKQKRLKSSTFWRLLGVKVRRKDTVEYVQRMVHQQGLNISVKSGALFGEEDKHDWIILTMKLLREPPELQSGPGPTPPGQAWFDSMQTREFESEREVEAHFILPLLQELGYEYNDIAIGFSVEMFKGVKKIKAEADFVIFDGPGRDRQDILLVLEAKSSEKGINLDHIGQARSYAQELLPAYYVISNGKEIQIFQFNGMLIPDERVMAIDRSDMQKQWAKLHSYISKAATVQRKKWMLEQISQAGK